ncbi:cupin-like domain-containing protein [Chitinophaga sp. sic0106]|uniref:cupin-like domain-containing protein n=1 Tax=Chitinophaga sp. sic0106 TaxID=2854785 RepID=UPI001C455193|nr:cupin-like domain-containing protein [Chitinophaga sp. sic0106]MBV7531548.1 cupin-like domain-containing protein [Chitinophaga sp. sic0106]
MNISSIDRVDTITPEEFKRNYYLPRKPVVITSLSKQWPAKEKWTWDYFKSIVGDKTVGVYNNTRADANTPVNGADDYIQFGDYLDLIQQGPVALRIFLFNIFQHAPQLTQDFTWPEAFSKGLLKKYPMLFVGGAGSVAHMHYDIDLSHIFHTQFVGRKRVLLLENKQSPYIYRMPFTVESAANFVNWHQQLNTADFPALDYATGFTTILEHGDTLFMPGGYWHHMEYLDSGFAMSLRALDHSLAGKLNGLYHIVGLRGMNNLLIKMAPRWWYHKKRELAKNKADRLIKAISA